MLWLDLLGRAHGSRDEWCSGVEFKKMEVVEAFKWSRGSWN